MNSRKLHAKIVECGLTKADVAKQLGLNEKTFYRKMQSGKFHLLEAARMIDILHIKNPDEIFFDL